MYIDFQASTNVTWVILDSVSVSEAVKHNSKYGYILFCALFGSATAPFVSAYTIKDGENGVNGMKRKTKIVRNIIDLAYYTFNVGIFVGSTSAVYSESTKFLCPCTKRSSQ